MIAPQAVTDFIVKMKSQTTQSKKNQHLAFIPKSIDDLLNQQVFEYFISDRKRRILNPAIEVCISLDNIKFMSMVSRAYRGLQDSITPVIDLIENCYIYPFILFVNGRFIPWENMALIVSYEKYYIIIYDLSQDMIRDVRHVRSMNAIVLPSNVIYSIGVEREDLKPVFSFDNKGLYNTDSWSHRIYMKNDEIDIEHFINPTANIELSNDRRFYSEDNFFYFDQEGYYKNDIIVNINRNQVKFNSDSIGTCLVMSNPKAIDNYKDNTYNIDIDKIREDILSLLDNSEDTKEYIKTLSESLDFTMYRNKSYEQNREEVIKYLMSYREDMFIELYEKGLDYFALQVDLNWLQAHTDEDGYLSIPRKSSSGCDYYVIVIHNGELYQYYKHHEYHSNRFICPIAAINEEDSIELLFFKNAKEYTLTNNYVTKDGEFLPLNKEYYNSRAKIFCKQTADTYFTYPLDGDQHFPIPFTLEENENGDSRIVFENDFYYGKSLTVVPDNTFKYFSYLMTDEDVASYKVSLDTKFNYCDEYDRYVVFLNGRRLSNDIYRMTIPCRSTTPFYRFEIYLSIPLEVNDRLEIFYLPNKIKDIDLAIDIPEDGKVVIDKSILPYVLSTTTYTYWVNGKKIPINDLKLINGNTVQLLKDQQSVQSFRITAMGEPIDEIENAYQEVIESKWTKALAEANAYDLLGIIIPTLNDTESDISSDSVPIKSIMYELIREHYLSNENVDVTAPFIYDYLDVDQTVISGEDSGGNSLIEVANAENRDNLDINRIYP